MTLSACCKAWRFWVLGALIGAFLAQLFILLPRRHIAPAPSVNVDFNLEQALPADTDRQHFYYLEREVAQTG
jgi:hypothetical protein